MSEAAPPGSATQSPPARRTVPRTLQYMPRTIAMVYLAFGALWIFSTDRLLAWLHLDTQRIQELQTFKGWLFVCASGTLVYLLLKRHERNSQTATQALLESQNQVRDMNAELERRVTQRTLQLESANRELEAFVYAVSHDLRAPLRSMSGFSQILHDTAPQELDEKSRHYLQRIHEASQRMSALIDDLLSLSRISRAELVARPTDLSQIAAEAAAALRDRYPDREVLLTIEPGMMIDGDTRLMRIAMENLLDNAWKYTAKARQASVSVGSQPGESGPVYFVRDNGVGFDMSYSAKLFGPFQRLHTEAEFPGTGIGLVTVQRIVARHGGRIWAVAQVNHGATFYFTLGA